MPSGERNKEIAGHRRKRIRRGLLWLVALLYVASIPWYRTSGETTSRLWGLPDWVAVALVCYVAIAVLNAVAWLLTDVPDAMSAEPGDEEHP